LYDAEHRILDALPAMMEEATNDDLKKAFEEHIEQTKKHVERLDDIFEMLDEKPKRHTCEGIKGLIEEGEAMISMITVPEVMDTALIAAAQKVEHYEISGYGTARAFAKMMDHDEAADLLQETLEEESETDELLTEIAESTVNPIAMEEASGMEMEDEAETRVEM
ncbi:ferritin-like domain-containing protein, partial [Candidatus Peregrinibacteria bacterium]|nr:ferritin-like domain-containing protein [Candidatus Peregrinibacteria bacterium]